MGSTCKYGRVVHVRRTLLHELCSVQAPYRVKGARVDASGPHIVRSCTFPLYTVPAENSLRWLLRSDQEPSCAYQNTARLALVTDRLCQAQAQAFGP